METTKTLTLDTPIKRGEAEIKEITLSKPNAGALRGASLRSLLDMDVSAIMTVLPRITEPPLLDAEIMRMDPADLLQAGAVVAGFLLPKQLLQEASAVAAPSQLQ